jgi:cytochrome d ubiquinol oxidase subunit I
MWAAIALPLTPLAANSFGWIFTEMGRQPWIVFGQMKTVNGVSPTVGAGEVIASLSTLTALYAVLAFIEIKLLLKYARSDLPDVAPAAEGEEQPLAFAY